MKKILFSIFLTLLFVSTLYLPNTFAQANSQLGLPEGAKTRLGKGYKTGSSIFSKDGTRFAVASSIGLWIYDVFTGQEVALLQWYQSDFTLMASSSDGRMLAIADENTIWLREINSNLHVATLTEHSENVTTLVFSPDSKVLASASEDNTIRLWDATTGKLLFLPLSEHTGDVISLTFSPDSQTLASGSTDKTIRLWSATTGQHLATLEEQIAWGTITHEGHTGDVTAVTFSPDGATLASGGTDNTIRLWDVGTRQHQTALTGHSLAVTALAFSSDGTMLASGSLDYTIRLWHPATRKHIDTLENYKIGVITLAFSLDGVTLASGHTGTLAQSWDGRTGEHLGARFLGNEVAYGDNVYAIAFSPDGVTLASGQGHTNLRTYQYNNPSVFDGSCPGWYRYYTGRYYSYSGSIWLWDPLIGESHSSLRSYEYDSLRYLPTGSEVYVSRDRGFVHALAFSPDNTILASAEEKSFLFEDYCGILDRLKDNKYFLRLWSADTGEHLLTREGHNGSITSVAFSSDGKILASGSRDDTIRLWNSTTGQHLTTFSEHRDDVNAVAFSPDGETLASGSDDDTIKLWNPDGQVRVTLYGHGHDVTSVAFSPDGKILASGSADSTIRLWDPTTGEPIATLEEHAAKVSSVAFSVDGGILASGSWDGTVRLWNSETGEPLLQFHGHSYGVTAVAFSPDGETLASGSDDGTILFWEIEPAVSQNPSDINGDGVVNILDLAAVASNFGQTGQNPADVNKDEIVNISDLILVASAMEAAPAAPSMHPQVTKALTAENIQKWLTHAKQLKVTDASMQKGIAVLEQLLATLKKTEAIPTETALLPNYPNPFNPETWIPYQLTKAADVSIFIYAADGKLIRALELGHKPVGIYQGKSRAAHWDGKNELGESVASGVYFYTLIAGDFTATRKMLIRK